MSQVEAVDLNDKRQVGRFLELPFRLYRGHPLWVPPIRIDAAAMLNPGKHPYYEHSEAEFFVAVRDSEVVGRLGLL
jgi:hypothetical protein